MHKKVGTITLEYDRGDGVIVSEAFQGEFNNAIFNGDISMLEGTFDGTLTAGTIDAVKNINIRGGSAALTTVGYVAEASRATGYLFNDDGVWRSVITTTFNVPEADEEGGWLSAGIQYRIDDAKRDNDYFPCEYRILIDGEVYFTSPQKTLFKWFYVTYKYFYHEVAKRITSPGAHTIALQYRWFDIGTNVYPEFFNVTIRADYFRK